MLVDFFLSPWHQKSVPYNEETYRRILIGGRSSVKTGVFPLNISWKKRLHENVVNKTPRPEAENDIRETGTNFNNETATSSVFAKH